MIRSVVIPAFNEEKSLGKLLKALTPLADFIVVVNDCSTDKTAQVIKEHKTAVLVENEINRGYSRSLETGIAKAVELNADVVLTIDADGQHPVEEIDKIFQLMDRQKFDMVVASRSSLPRLSEIIVSKLTKLLWDIDDITSGMKCYKSSLVESANIPKSFDSTGTYIAFFAVTHSYSYETIPITTKQRLDESRYGTGIKKEIQLLSSIGRCLLWLTMRKVRALI